MARAARPLFIALYTDEDVTGDLAPALRPPTEAIFLKPAGVKGPLPGERALELFERLGARFDLRLWQDG